MPYYDTEGNELTEEHRIKSCGLFLRKRSTRRKKEIPIETVTVRCMHEDCANEAQVPKLKEGGPYPALELANWGIAEGMYHVCPWHNMLFVIQIMMTKYNLPAAEFAAAIEEEEITTTAKRDNLVWRLLCKETWNSPTLFLSAIAFLIEYNEKRYI